MTTNNNDAWEIHMTTGNDGAAADVELTDAERDLLVVATALFGWAIHDEAMEATEKATVQIVTDRLRAVEAESNPPRAIKWRDQRDKAEAALAEARQREERAGVEWSAFVGDEQVGVGTTENRSSAWDDTVAWQRDGYSAELRSRPVGEWKRADDA